MEALPWSISTKNWARFPPYLVEALAYWLAFVFETGSPVAKTSLKLTFYLKITMSF